MNPHQKPGSPNPATAGGPEGELAENPAVDEFFTRLSYDMRHPKPGQEGIAAALQAIQRLALEVDAEESAVTEVSPEPATGRTCQVCGALNRPQHRFCATCGVPLEESPALEAPAPEPPAAQAHDPQPSIAHAPGDHHYHHHYHHHYFSSDGAIPAPSAEPRAARDARVRAPLTGPNLSRAEAAVRQLTRDLAQACNTKQLDDLVSLYGSDALVMRPNFPVVRGGAAIREFFFAALDAGLGEVEMEPLRVELFGDVAYEAGRCKMLVPSAMGKRREERGKYLIVANRQTGGEWKVLADCWSSDLSLGTEQKPQSPPRKTS